MSTMSIDDDRISFLDMIPYDLGHGEGEVDAAVGSVAFVDASSEFMTPCGVVKSLVAVEGHPVGDIGGVGSAAGVGAGQGGW